MSSQSLDDYARLSPDLVIQAVESTGRLSDARVMALNSYENRVYQVGIEESLPLIAKFYRPGRWSDDQIREEHHFCRELAEAELPVVGPVPDTAGETLHGFEGYRFTLFPRKGGQAPEPGDLDQLHRIGMLMGRMHAVGRKQPFHHRPALTAERFLEAPSRVILGGCFLPDNLRDAYEAVIARLRALVASSGLEGSATLRTHGDSHPGNILWTRDDGPWLVDFDDCQSAPAVQDLWMMLAGSRQEQELQLAEMLDGYTMFHDFNPAEIPLIEALRSLRMIHYAGWLATRWEDPAFPRYFPWFNTDHYWREHIGELEQQALRMEAEPLRLL